MACGSWRACRGYSASWNLNLEVILTDCCPKGVLQLSPSSGSILSFELAAEAYFALSCLELSGLLKMDVLK